MKVNTNPSKSLTDIIYKLCGFAKIERYNFNRGCKLFDNYQRITLLVIYIQSKKSLREFVSNRDGVLSYWKSKLKLKKIPSKSTLHSWLKSFSTDIIRILLNTTICHLNPKILAIDGTGIDANHNSSYYNKRLSHFGGENKVVRWHKLDLTIDIKTKLILDFSFLIRWRHDIIVAQKIFKRLKYRKVKILADKGYYSYKLFKLIKKLSGELIVPLKNYGKKCVHNNFIRDEFNNCFTENSDIYSLRNNVESVFSSLKRVQNLTLRSKLHYMKKRELAWHLLWYNIRTKISSLLKLLYVLIEELFENGCLEVDFLEKLN